MAASALTRSPAALTWPAGGANEIRRVPRGGMYYPDQARYAALAAERLRYRFRDLDNGNGYLFAVEHDGRRLTAGAGAVCCYPINNATAYTIARDKAHTKAVLREQGVATIPGRLFFASGARAALRNPGH